VRRAQIRPRRLRSQKARELPGQNALQVMAVLADANFGIEPGIHPDV
jgi:hypothetical protein